MSSVKIHDLIEMVFILYLVKYLYFEVRKAEGDKKHLREKICYY